MPTLTVASVQKYTAQAKRREIPDAKATGLYLVIQPRSGAKSWCLRFRRPDGRSGKLWLGRVDLAETETSDEPVIGGALTLRQARELANRIDRQRARGIDVIKERKAALERKHAADQDRAANVFGSLVRRFFIEYRTGKWQTRPRRWHESAALLGLRWKPGSDPAKVEPEIIGGGLADIWRDKPVGGVDGHDIHSIVAEAEKGKGGSRGRARKTHAALSVFFRWLLQERRVASNPCGGVHKPGPPPPSERVLSDGELAAFWKACGEINAPFGALFKILLICGCRLREAAGMRRSELAADNVWTVPPERSKNHRSFSLPLPSLALEIINELPVIDGGLVFTTNGRTPVSGFSVAKKQLDLAVTKIAGHPVHFRLHDLRRTFASNLAALGIALPVIEKLLNHTSGSFAGVVSVYQKFEFNPEKKKALSRWAQHLTGLTGDVSGKVLPMKRGRK
jgi:integrase